MNILTNLAAENWKFLLHIAWQVLILEVYVERHHNIILNMKTYVTASASSLFHSWLIIV
jgi:hypothetical protein